MIRIIQGKPYFSNSWGFVLTFYYLLEIGRSSRDHLWHSRSRFWPFQVCSIIFYLQNFTNRFHSLYWFGNIYVFNPWHRHILWSISGESYSWAYPLYSRLWSRSYVPRTLPRTSLFWSKSHIHRWSSIVCAVQRSHHFGQKFLDGPCFPVLIRICWKPCTRNWGK